jgi:hypothetical protein
MGGEGIIPYSYHTPGQRFLQGTNYEALTTAPIPQWYLVASNHLHYALIDQAANRVVDFVNLEDQVKIYDLTQAITNNVDCSDQFVPNSVWCTEPVNGTPAIPWSSLQPGTVISKGVNAQLAASLGAAPAIYTATNAASRDFQNFVADPKALSGTNETSYDPIYATNLTTCWQANDPLVHYTPNDLNDPSQQADKVAFPPTLPNHHYSPWDYATADSKTPFVSMAMKDPLVGNSDSWQFLTNRFPNVGWLGRVHRGTPWQTIYMKSAVANLGSWTNWTGDGVYYTNGNARTPDGAFTQPIQDYALFDVFTTGLSENAQRGQLNINQTNLAAWSAVLSGVNVLSNSTAAGPVPMVISPAGVFSPANPTPLAQIVQSINDARGNTTSTNNLFFANQTFQHLGDVLSAPALTVASPFLNTNVNTVNLVGASGLSDAVVERIPQQIMSLLSLSQTPRFVIYSFGQTLHPAEKSLVIGGTFNGLCTNYQITAESAVRAVVRVEGSLDPKNKNNSDPLHHYPPHMVVEQFNVLPPD